MNKTDDNWFTCPVCGEVVREGALACPACGADDETGWSADAAYDGVDLPDEAFGDPPRRLQQSTVRTAIISGILVVLLVLLLLFYSFGR